MATPSIIPKIHLLLPFKSPFSENAGAVSTIVRDLIAEGTKPETRPYLEKK